MNSILLIGDIGGTKTTLALIEAAGDPRRFLREATYPSARFTNLEEIVNLFLAAGGESVQAACFGVAGPVLSGRSTITNLPWVLDEEELAERTGIPAVLLINDLEAIAGAVPHLFDEDMLVVQPGQPVNRGPLAVIAAGTGLGQAYALWCGARYLAVGTEGGHVEFAPADDIQTDLLAFMRKRHDHVSVERVCSGSGLINLYEFLLASGRGDEPDWLAERLRNSADPTPVLVAAALDQVRPCILCRQTIELFTSILAAQAGNLALSIMATGGVFIAGGMPPRLLPFLQRPEFLARFTGKGRMSGLAHRMPLAVVRDPRISLWGAGHRLRVILA
ncbi:glucokinase [bacterium]|nr:glucokinase [candidate division CSSED10-310 bacterium]